MLIPLEWPGAQSTSKKGSVTDALSSAEKAGKGDGELGSELGGERAGAGEDGVDAEEAGEKEATIDFKVGKAVVEAEVGQALMRKHPAQAGKPGEDLFGKPVAAREGKDATLPLGEGTEIDEANPNLAKAKVGGFVRFDKNLLCVRECFVVTGSVDYSVGNVRFAKSVLVQGDVKDGFAVESGGDVSIGGTVGDARVTALGSVSIARGCTGTGKGSIESQGSIEVGFLSNQRLKAYEDILVAKESFNANLSTRASLKVMGPLVGGMAVAGLAVQCRALGNAMGTRTEVEIGIDYLDVERRTGLEKKIRELKSAGHAIQGYRSKAKEDYQKTKTLDAATIRKLTLMREKLEKIQTALPTLEKRKEEVLERIRQGYAREGIELIVEGRVYPGAVIKAGDSNLRISEELPGPRRFVYKDFRLHAY
jgi:uncharacterized protein (DUF342 family)